MAINSCYCSAVWVHYISLPVICILATSMGHSSGARLSALPTRLWPTSKTNMTEQQELVGLGIACSMAEHVLICWGKDRIRYQSMCMWILIDVFIYLLAYTKLVFSLWVTDIPIAAVDIILMNISVHTHWSVLWGSGSWHCPVIQIWIFVSAMKPHTDSSALSLPQLLPFHHHHPPCHYFTDPFPSLSLSLWASR